MKYGKQLNTIELLDMANSYANTMSGCTKVSVGAVITKDGQPISFGANRTIPDLCRFRGCLRVELYGDNAKEHRLPSDCRAIHSEIDAICGSRESLIEASIYVTRYPCEACARAIVASGIKEVYYGRIEKISQETERIFSAGGIIVIHCKEWVEEDNNA